MRDFEFWKMAYENERGEMPNDLKWAMKMGKSRLKNIKKFLARILIS